jgi:myo-inositol 2-dehydrogenase/D-chiro-inositol 1-dehydrogenase
MNQSSNPSFKQSNRRDFIKKSGILAGTGLLVSSLPVSASGYSLSANTLKVALIGCGSRGAGAAVNALRTKGSVELVAMADVFRDKLDETLATLQKMDDIKSKIKVPEANKLIGFDAYQKAIASGVSTYSF